MKDGEVVKLRGMRGNEVGEVVKVKGDEGE